MSRPLGAVALLALLALGFAVQAAFFARFPQPPLFGDAAGYFWAGQETRAALGQLAAGDPAAAFARVRPFLHFLGVGALFAFLPGDRPGDVAAFRLLLASIGTFGLLGTFLLARRLGGHPAAGYAALALAVLHPSLAMLAGRLYPEPVAASLIVWAAYLYARGVETRARAWLAGAGALLIAALLFRPKLIPYFLLALAGVSALVWLRTRSARGPVLALALGWALAGGAWVAGALLATGHVDAKLPEYNLAWKQYYPYGFWQFLDSHGYEGPFRLKTEPYYVALESAAKADPELLRSRARQYSFTIGYLAGRPREALLTALDSAWRLYSRPENPYRWDYPFDYGAQHLLQVAIVALALAGFVALAAEASPGVAVAFVPLVLLGLHMLAFSLPRYGAPPLLILVATAGSFVGFCARRRPERPGAIRAAAALGLLAALGYGIGDQLLSRSPLAGLVMREAARFVLLALPLFLAWRLDPRARRLALVAAGCILTLLAAHTLHDPDWHERETRLSSGILGVEQEIVLDATSLAALRSASEAFVAFDLSVPRGDARSLSLSINGISRPGSELEPTMPRLPEDTTVGGKDWRGYPQWWALRLLPEMIPPAPEQPLRIQLHGAGSGVRVRGDRFPGQARLYEGPSFGDWPHLVPVKLQYDGDYRIPVRMPLSSLATRSSVLGRSGPREASSVHRIRLVTLASNEGSALWDTAPAGPGPMPVAAFAARSGTSRRTAELTIEGHATFPAVPLGQAELFHLSEAPYTLCHVPEGERGEDPYGAYFLRGPRGAGGAPWRIRLRFLTGMRDERAFFLLDRKRPLHELATLYARCPGAEAKAAVFSGTGQLIDMTRNSYPQDTGRWRVDRVF